MIALEREGNPEIWETELAEVAGDELAVVRASLTSAIIERSPSREDLEPGKLQVMGSLRTSLGFASDGQKIDEVRLKAQVDQILDPSLRRVVKDTGDLIRKVQEKTQIPLGYLGVHLAYEANNVIVQFEKTYPQPVSPELRLA